MNYLSKDIRTIHNAILDGKVTPLDLVIEAISLAKKDNNNAFEYICEKEAIQKAKSLDKNKISKLLYGIPVVIKDNYATKDIPTTASSNILNGYVPVFSSEVVTRLENEGAIVIGKSTMDELAMGGTGTNGHLGITYNPWDKSHTHIIGGSSSGSAASVSAGIVPFSIGSDTGDSVRKPASYAGLVGLKPTWGRISRYGLFPFACSLDHVAYFTRNVFDSACILNVLAGRDDKDFSSSFKEVEDYTKQLDNPLLGKKIAVIKEINDSVSSQTIKEQFNKTVAFLRDNGAVVDEISIDQKLLRAIYSTYIIIASAEATSNYASLDGIKFGNRIDGNSYEEVVKKTRTAGFSAYAKRRFVIGSLSLLKENQNELFLRAQKCRRLIVNAFNKVFEKYDAIYAPASPTVAPLIKTTKVQIDNDSLIADNYMAFANLGGFPSITIPIGFCDGLPFGGNLTAKPFDESNLLNIANELEKKTGLANIVAGK
ncbi:MAG: Asp-tRNA(Asn)/Glu-tRNA(Gln) amidotransferase subunit GatA [Bacilli bacterium]|nr:Asp-tRNA(Asn)/Glu-tRNA(Gln) amidotransferase subunit GatA [Bacilli bacterium]